MPLAVEHIEGRFLAGAQRELAATAAGRLFFQHAQRRQTSGRRGADKACAFAMRTFAGGGFQHAGAQALAAHFEQAELADPADLNAGAVIGERRLHRLFNLTDVGVGLHVDKVDDDETGHVAQAQLAGDFLRRFKVSGDRRLLDAVFAGRAAGVDVDRHQSFGRVDDQITARLQLNDRVIHRLELIFGAITLIERNSVGIGLHLLHMARHQQLHEVARLLIAAFALHNDFVNVAIVDVADRPLNQVAILIDEGGRLALQRGFTDIIPQSGEIIEITLDFGLGALEPRGPDDAAHGGRQSEFRHDGLQALTVCRV